MRSNFKQKPLNEQVIVITGGSSGIGLACAKKAGSRGAQVVITSNDEIELQNAKDKLQKQGITVEYKAADVSDYEALKEVGEFTEETFGRIDTWINDAGVAIAGELMDVPAEDARRLFDVNYWGVVNGCKVAFAHMKKSGGTIINIGSIESIVAVPLQGTYSASKHAVKGYSDALRMELEKAGYPINVTLIKPSGIDTPIIDHGKNLLDKKGAIPPPLYEPEVAADAILFCAENPRRSFTIGGAGMAMTLGAKFFPAGWQTLMKTIGWPLLTKEGKPKRVGELHEPTEHEARIHGKRDYFYVRKFSLYDTIAKNPLLSAGIFSVVSALLYSKFSGGNKS